MISARRGLPSGQGAGILEREPGRYARLLHHHRGFARHAVPATDPLSVCGPPCFVVLYDTDHVGLRVEAATADIVRVSELPSQAASRAGPRRR
jgi:hypothetical protein